MNSKNLVRTGVFTFTICSAIFLMFPSVASAQQPDKQLLLRKARNAYYSLKKEGMQKFSCDMTPNWANLLEEQRKTNPAGIARAIEKLNQLKFSVEVDSKGDAKVQHTEIAAENPEMAQGLSQIYSGMEQMTTGFFQTWAVFVVRPALPEVGTEFRLESDAKLHHIAYKEGETDVAVTMNRQFAINSVKVTAEKFVSTINPQFATTGKGYLLTGYDAEYQGATAEDRTVLHVKLDNQKVAGIQIPQKLALQGSYNGSPFAVEVAFSGCTPTMLIELK